jgi:hypothetical protein
LASRAGLRGIQVKRFSGFFCLGQGKEIARIRIGEITTSPQHQLFTVVYVYGISKIYEKETYIIE